MFCRFIKRQIICCAVGILLFISGVAGASDNGIRIKDLARLDGVRDNSLSGYGLVIGLAGTGDSSRSRATLQSVANMLKSFGVVVPANELNSRNVAAVIITSTLPAFSDSGRKLDVNVSSIGDSRSLVGGTLLLAPLKGADSKVYALAQGSVSVGGFKYDMYGNMVQKNHPTVGIISGGATVEKGVDTSVINVNGSIDFILHNPDYTTSGRVADSINRFLREDRAKAVHAGKIRVSLSSYQRKNIVDFIRSLENLTIVPDQKAKVVINERTGTVVSGGDVVLSKVTVTHGELKVSIMSDYKVSQPGLVIGGDSDVKTVVTADTEISVSEKAAQAVSMPSGTSVADLVAALNRIKTSTRDVIVILQAIRRAGGLHAELVIQ